jgi:hypothetical protein
MRQQTSAAQMPIDDCDNSNTFINNSTGIGLITSLNPSWKSERVGVTTLRDTILATNIPSHPTSSIIIHESPIIIRSA